MACGEPTTLPGGYGVRTERGNEGVKTIIYYKNRAYILPGGYGVRADRGNKGVKTIIYYKNRVSCLPWGGKTTLISQEEEGMASPARRPRPARTGTTIPPHEEPPLRKKVGRPKGPPSTIVNLRLPVELLARRDRSIDRLETQTGLHAHRGMIARRAFALFLETHETS